MHVFHHEKLETRKSSNQFREKIQKILRPHNFANTLRESYVIVLAYANALSRPTLHFRDPMSSCRDHKWLRLNIKRSDNKESIAESESTHLEVLGTAVASPRS